MALKSAKTGSVTTTDVTTAAVDVGFEGVGLPTPPIGPTSTVKRLSLTGILVSVLIVMALSGAAWAYFRSTGSGTGSGSTGTMQIVTVAAISGDTPATLLLPGTSGEVILRVHNPNPTQVRVTDVSSASAITVVGGSGCTPANSAVAFANQTGLSIPIPAGGGSTLVRLPGAGVMATSSANGCQGATFSIPVTITVHWP